MDARQYAIYIVESKLRNSSELNKFYENKSPSFRNFSQIRSEVEANGTGFDLIMMVTYLEFKELVTSHVDDILQELNVTIADFGTRLQAIDDECALSLLDLLEKAHNFIEFAMMMESNYLKLYEGVSGPSFAVKIAPTKRIVSGQKCVRVLWDIENISVSKAMGGLKTVEKLRNFLKLKGWVAPGLDTRITAFFNPSGHAVSQKTIGELDKSGVELVWVSQKREDADRKLGLRISQEVQVLNPGSTTFIILSSDQDFISHMQLLQNSGFHVVVIHKANSEKWKTSLEMHANEGYSWADVVETLDIEDGAETKNTEESNVESIAEIAREKLEIYRLGWIDGSCTRWKGIFGFVHVNIADLNTLLNKGDRESIENWKHFQKFQEDLQDALAAQADVSESEQSIRVYVHYKALENNRGPTESLPKVISHGNGDVNVNKDDESIGIRSVKRSMSSLQRGEKVQVFIVIGHRGLRAEAVIRKETALDSVQKRQTDTTVAGVEGVEKEGKGKHNREL